MNSRNIKCFIAMPFGRDDCDRLYKRSIKPVLRALKITPIRVDQREHKEDLNLYIIKMLNESDMALADLTYARPSVYYEAGFAEHRISVVYTAREDHLSNKQKDDNLRVHFDLGMKKIVPWRDPADPVFAKRLRQRVDYFARPLREEKERNEQIDKSRSEFTAKSVKTRLAEIEGEFYKRLSQKRFWIRPLGEMNRDLAFRYTPATVSIAVKIIEDTCYFCVVLIGDSFTNAQIRNAVNYLSYEWFLHREECTNFIEWYFICSLRKLTEARLTSLLPNAARCESIKGLSMPFKQFHSKEVLNKNIILISPIDSSLRMKKAISEHLAALPRERTNRYTFLTKSADFPSSGLARISFKKAHPL